MKLTMLITTLLIGASTMASVAVAQPTYAPSSSPYYRGEYHHHRRANRVPPPYEQGGWTYRDGSYFPVPYDQGQGMSDGFRPVYGNINYGDGQREIRFDNERQRFSALRIDPRDNLFVSKVLVTYADGRSDLIQVGRWVRARQDGGLQIDLDGRRRLNRVMVYTPGQRDVDFALLAR